MALIEIKNLSFRYTKHFRAVNNVSLSIERGEHVCILGHNGSGKSTLAKLLVGLLLPASGEIYIAGQKLTEASADDLRKYLGIVFQNPDNQFVGVTVKDDIAFGLENNRVPRPEMLEKIARFARLVGMEDYLSRNPEELSGGEKQRVALAGVLAMNPEIIILDEATSMIDPQGVRDIAEIVKGLKGERTLITITHNLEEALLADRVIVMNDGKIILEGTPEAVFSEPDILKAANLDILETMKIRKALEELPLPEQYKTKLFEALWELNFPQ